jgi:hypothetical protein
MSDIQFGRPLNESTPTDFAFALLLMAMGSGEFGGTGYGEAVVGNTFWVIADSEAIPSTDKIALIRFSADFSDSVSAHLLPMTA